MTYTEEYRSKLATVEGALAKIKTGDVISTGKYIEEPFSILSKLHTVIESGQVEHLTVWAINPNADYEFITSEVCRDHLDIYSTFYSKCLREMHKKGNVTLAPVDLHRAGKGMVACKRPTVFICAVTPMNDDGYFCMPASLQIEWECLESADLVIFEVVKGIPFVDGDIYVPISKVDVIVEADHPISTTAEAPITDIEQRIGGYVADMIHDGDCIQMGFGGMPNSVCNALKDKKDLGIHTEMLTTSMARMMEAGVITNARKNIDTGKSVSAFFWGTPWLYEYVDHNPGILMKKSEYVNDPFVIASINNMVSVNTALQVDLTGQVCSESIGYQQYSGIGGACDFAFGASHSKGGKSIIAVSSTTKGGTISRIQPCLSYGAIVTIPRTTVDYVVTEYGVAKLKFCSIAQRVENLINVAHPDFREDLRRQAAEMMIR